MKPSDVIQEVGDLVREAAHTAVLPLFQKLTAADVAEKAPGELVTTADRRSEEIITAGLLRLLPDSTVVGEEAVAFDPGIMHRLRGSGAVWLVDPLDGTGNFAAGRRPFAVMVALLRAGEPVAGWILDVLADRLAVAELGAGAYLDGERVTARSDHASPGTLRGAVMSRYLPPDLRGSVREHGAAVGEILTGAHCAGHEYPDVVSGVQDFVLFWRTLPWDHAPGVLFAREAGGVARRLDGTDYHPTDDRRGLLVAANPQIWQDVRGTLFDGHRL